jgi:putative methyltransferase (TIGR04325 family)
VNLINRLARNPSINRAAKAALAKLPFFVRKTITDAIRSGVRKSYRFAGIYPTFESFPHPVPPPDSTRPDFARSGLASVGRDDTTGLPILGHQHHLLPLVAATIGHKVCILDFGGSGGIDYLGLLRAARLTSTYCIVETPALYAAGRELWPDDEYISFSEELPPPNERFDIVYAWSAIQYVPDLIGLMVRFTDYRPHAILIVYTPFAERGFVRGQGAKQAGFPSWVISLPEMEAAMKKVGYRLAFGIGEETLLNVSNFPKEYRVGNMTTLLFVPSEFLQSAD